MKWTIVIPSVRPLAVVAPTVQRLLETLTQPTDFHLLHGSAGKSVTLNKHLRKEDFLASRRFFDPLSSEYYATIDDDVALPLGWQDDVEAAFRNISGLGACGIFYGRSEKMTQYMMEVNHAEVYQNETVFFPLHTCNVAGACFITTGTIAGKIGPYPHNGSSRYEYDEDGWRSMRVKQLGYRLGYVCARGGCAEMLEYPDSEEYLEMKRRDTEELRLRRDELFGEEK